MASERVTVGGCHGLFLRLDGEVLAFVPDDRAEEARRQRDTLNAAFDKVEADAKRDECTRCASLVAAMSGEVPQAKWIAEQIQRTPA